MECLIQSVTFLKANFQNYFEKYEDCIHEAIKNNQNLTEMKIAIDFIYAVGTYCPLTIFKNKKKFIMCLDNLKSHKNQPIRVSA